MLTPGVRGQSPENTISSAPPSRSGSHARLRSPDPPRSRRGAQGGGTGPGAADAYAVTPALREWYVSDDIEELEYAALSRAAPGVPAAARRGPEAPRRRVVVALDVPDGQAVADPDRGLDQSALGEVRMPPPCR